MITPSPLYEAHSCGVVEPDKWNRLGSGPSTKYLQRQDDPSAARPTPQAPTRNTEWISMPCLKCAHLGQLFESKLSKYGKARSAMFHRVSTDLAAKKEVDMERARYDLEEHQLICPMRTSEASYPQGGISWQPSRQLQPLAMTGGSDQVVALIKELLVLNRTESVFGLAGSTVKQIEERRAIRKRIRQELVRVLHLGGRRNP